MDRGGAAAGGEYDVYLVPGAGALTPQDLTALFRASVDKRFYPAFYPDGFQIPQTIANTGFFHGVPSADQGCEKPLGMA